MLNGRPKWERADTVRSAEDALALTDGDRRDMAGEAELVVFLSVRTDPNSDGKM